MGVVSIPWMVSTWIKKKACAIIPECNFTRYSVNGVCSTNLGFEKKKKEFNQSLECNYS